MEQAQHFCQKINEKYLRMTYKSKKKKSFSLVKYMWYKVNI